MTIAIVLAIGSLLSCTQTIEKGPKLSLGMDEDLLFVFNPSTCRYEIPQDVDLTVTKSGDELTTLRETLERNNSFLDSIIRSSIKEGAGVAYFTEGKSKVLYKATISNSRLQMSEIPNEEDSTFVDVPVDTLAVIDSIPRLHSPRGTLGNRDVVREFAPYYMTGYDCSCFGHSPFVIHVVKTVYLDPHPVIGTCHGLAAEVWVPVTASNTSGTISYESTDSNAPFCMYIGDPSEEPEWR